MTTSFENAMIAAIVLAFIAVCIGSWVIHRYVRNPPDSYSEGDRDVELVATSSINASIDADKASRDRVPVSSARKA